MTKARRMMVDALKQIDVVVELLDARAPVASRNPDFDELFAQKERIVVLNKSDLADDAQSKRWAEYMRGQGRQCLPFVSTRSGEKGRALKAIENAAKPIVERMAQKGVKKTVRIMVTGIPNVGKSTFINTLSGMGNTTTGNRPGVTRGKQWVRLSPYLELLDTPGMLWPKLEDRQEALHLAYIGAIRDAILDTEELSISLLATLRRRWPDALFARYKKIDSETPEESLLEEVCRSRGFLLGGGQLDTERAATTVLEEFRSGKIGRFTLDECPAPPREAKKA